MSRDAATEIEQDLTSQDSSINDDDTVVVSFEESVTRVSPWGSFGQSHSGQPPGYLWFYVVGMSIFSVIILFQLFARIPHVPDIPQVATSSSKDHIQHDLDEASRFRVIRTLFVMTMGMTLCCGALGGCLFDMRGLIKHSAGGDFDPLYSASYLLRPFAGATSGFIVFLVLVGGLFSLEIQPPTNQKVEQDWIILRRQLPFMAFAMLAGYASHVFMMKLKDISEVVFSSSDRVKSDAETKG